LNESGISSGQFRTPRLFGNTIVRSITLVAAMLLAACGGGGGGGSFAPSPPPPPAGGGWQAGVFTDASGFFARCAAPRTGVHPITNQPWSDVQGTTTDENNFLRSYSNDTYLWYNEITDQNPALFNNPLNYFDELRTFADSLSATPGACLNGLSTNGDASACKDKFHFWYGTDEWIQLSQSGTSVGYGAQFALISASPPRQIVIAYTEPNSPATNLAIPLARGTEIISADGAAVVDGDAGVLNAALFPSDASTSHTFEVLDLGAQNTRMVTMTPTAITSAPVQNTQVIDTGSGRVGYMLFNDHIATSEQGLIDAVNQLNSGLGITDLVLDVRYNGGGYLAIASELAYMIAGPGPTAGQRFELLQFNDKYPSINPITGQAISQTPFYTTTLGAPFNGNGGNAGQALPTLNLARVFVLTGSGTCSASEAVMNGLRGVNVEVIQIGSTTCGKPYGFYATDNCGTTYFSIQFRGVNAMNFGDYTDGFSPANTLNNIGTTVPGCNVADDFTAQLGDQTETRLAAALNYRDTGLCPAPSGIAPPGVSKLEALSATDAIIPKSVWQTNRILLPQ